MKEIGVEQPDLENREVLMKDIRELWNKKEDLCPELKKFLVEVGSGLMLKHPLVFDIFYHEQMNAILNERLRAKREYLEKALKEKDWHIVLGLYERPYRIDAVFEMSRFMTDEEYWDSVCWVWMDSENLWEVTDVLEELFWPSNHDLEKRHLLMNKEELVLLKDLSEVVTVYRGCGEKNREGWSWSLDKEVAELFVRRSSQKDSQVVTAVVGHADIVAFFNGRQEQEIVAPPDTVVIDE